MRKKVELSQKNFDKLLSWLNEDGALAAEKYESIRLRLIKIFVVRGSLIAEELADEAIDRVTNKIFEIADFYQGDVEAYFYGVAQNVFLESLRKPKLEELPIYLTKKEEISLDNNPDENLGCLKTCLQEIDETKRRLILDYYEDEKKDKIKNRKIIADKYGTSPEILRTKAFRIRTALQKCVLKCLEKK
jgi:DNA-directed RNA polymerase specialized sigma24 family protein